MSNRISDIEGDYHQAVLFFQIVDEQYRFVESFCLKLLLISNHYALATPKKRLGSSSYIDKMPTITSYGQTPNATRHAATSITNASNTSKKKNARNQIWMTS